MRHQRHGVLNGVLALACSIALLILCSASVRADSRSTPKTKPQSHSRFNALQLLGQQFARLANSGASSNPLLRGFNEGVSSDDILYFVKPDGTMWWQSNTITTQDSFDKGKYFTEHVTTKLSEPVQVSDGWTVKLDGKMLYKDILPGGASTMYALWSGGPLIWYRHDGYLDGTKAWQGGGGGDNQKATDWNQYDKVIPMGNGVLYTLTKDGTLRWNMHTSYKTGGGYLREWAPAMDVMPGWNQYKTIVGGGNGVFYVVTNDGKLLWYRHTFLQPVAIPVGAGSGAVGAAKKIAWAKTWQGPKEIGSGGWTDFTKIFCAGNGHIYAIAPDGKLNFYDHTGWQTGAVTWGFSDTKDHGIAEGWQDYVFAFAAMPGEAAHSALRSKVQGNTP